MSLEEYAELVKSLQKTMEGLQQSLESLRAENAQLRGMLFGRRGEKIPPTEREVAKRQGDTQARRDRTKAKRANAAQRRRELPEVEVVHPVAPEQENCPECHGAFRDLGEGEASSEIEYVPGRFVRRRHLRKKRVCRCGDTIVVAEAPARVADGVQYGPGLHAHVAVSKCADSLPLYRQSKRLKREGIDIGDSTLGDIFHRTAQCCEPLYDLVLEEVARSGHVNADETPIRVLAGGSAGKTRRAYVWTFIGAGHVAFVYSPSRSGETPTTVLGAHRGFLQVDAYSGYNKVCTPAGWTRVGCLAHVRRYFFNALDTAPEAAKEAMERILAIYEVEYEAQLAGTVGTDAHRQLRQSKARPLFDALYAWLLEQKDHHPPKSPIAKAISYALSAWETLLVYLDHPDVRPDNNYAESALRAVALGRKNFLFVGNDDAGKSLAVLQTIVATCQAHDVNPQAYLADILIRSQTHPKSQKRDLLPDRWKELFAS